MFRKATCHNSHARALHEAREQQQSADDAPPRRPALHPARYYNAKRDECAELEDDVKGDEEADGPPHAAEVFVLGARLLVRERGAGARDARAAAVEAQGDFALVILGRLAEFWGGSRVEESSKQGGRERTELKLAHRGMMMLAIVKAVPARLSPCHLHAFFYFSRTYRQQ